MWRVKYKHLHSDCLYTPKLKELELKVQLYHMGSYEKDGYVYATALQKLEGSQENIKKYIKYLQSLKEIVKSEILSDKSIMTLAKHKKEIQMYASSYDPIFIYPTPVYVSEDGFEVYELICWEKEPLQKHLKAMETNPTTTHFEIVYFREETLNEIYSLGLLPKLPPKQTEAINLAFRNGYYETPRKITLTELAQIAKVSKSTFQENLTKAENKLMPKLISS